MAGLWSALPPEVNAGQLIAGDQGASIAAAAAIAYEALAAALIAEGAKMAATAGTTAATGWEGVGGAAMVATAMPYVAALEALSGWVQQSAASAAAIVQAYATAKAAMIQVPVCTPTAPPGRLVATNIIGQNTPAIIALDIEYFGHFWPQNAGNMGGYEAIVTPIIAGLGIPPPPAPLTANPAGSGRPGRGDRRRRQPTVRPAPRCRRACRASNRPPAPSNRAPPLRRAPRSRWLDGPADAEPARPAAADARTISSDARPVPADARPVPTDGDGHAGTADQRYERERLTGGLEKAAGELDTTTLRGDHRRRCPRRWRRRRRHRRRHRGDVQLHPAHRQLQCAGSAEAADRMGAGAAGRRK